MVMFSVLAVMPTGTAADAMAFGASSAASFSFGGTPAASAPSLFGTPAANVSAPSLFGGTPASGGSLFGGGSAPASTPSPFGTPAPAPSLFGAASTPALLGGALAGGGMFGGTSAPASTPSLFGGAPGGSLFGGASSAAFGAVSSTPSLFGGAPAPASGSLFGGFGTTQPAAQTSTFGAFGAPQPQPQQQQQLAAFGGPLQPDLAAVRELDALKDAFTAGPGHPRYRFACLLLNVVDNPAARVKPNGVDDLAWREALQRAGGHTNPDRLWPVLAAGYSDLLSREGAQAAALEEHRQRLGAAAGAVRELGRRREALLSGRLEAARRREAQLGAQLLRAWRQIDALEGRFAAAMGHRPPGAAAAAVAADDRLCALEKDLSATSAAGLPRRIAALGDRAAERLETAQNLDKSSGDGDGGGLDEGSTKQLLSILKQQQQSLAALEEVLQTDNRDVVIMLDNGADAVPMTVITV